MTTFDAITILVATVMAWALAALAVHGLLDAWGDQHPAARALLMAVPPVGVVIAPFVALASVTAGRPRATR